MEPAAVANRVEQMLDAFEATDSPIALEGGLLNHLWRLPGQPTSVIAKHTPPHIASQPDVSLDPSRHRFEAAALRAFEPRGRLADLSEDRLRPPRYLADDPDRSLLVMEDLGDPPSLDEWLVDPAVAECAPPPAEVGRRLGRFIGRLHAETTGDATLREQFFNAPIQRTRREIQYEPVRELLEERAIDDAAALGTAAAETGEHFCQPGHCLVMGDLWPPSVLVAAAGLRVIDWEFCSFGRAVQDTAHLWAHLWMLRQDAPAPLAERVGELRDGFAAGYRAAATPAGDRLATRPLLRHGAIHAGCEVLARTVGAFAETGALAATDSETLRRALRVAADAIRHPEETTFFATFAKM